MHAVKAEAIGRFQNNVFLTCSTCDVPFDEMDSRF